MNYLAHIFLSGESPAWQLGGFLGDFIKGPLPEFAADSNRFSSLPEETLLGVKLHRKLDAHVDALEEYKASLELIGSEYQRWGGVALDVFFDHLLSECWEDFHDLPLNQYSHSFYRQGLEYKEHLPDRAAVFLERAQWFNLFERYKEPEVFLDVLTRIETRLTPRAKENSNLVSAGEAFLQCKEQIYPHFTVLMDQLLAFSDDFRLHSLKSL